MQKLQVLTMNIVLIFILKELQANIICKVICHPKNQFINNVLKLCYLEPQ